jgi:serine/threonine protein kinase
MFSPLALSAHFTADEVSLLPLRSHNVVETVDLVQDEQQHWCEVMEYCPGGDLYAAIKKGDLEPAEINSYFKQIIAGISYLHSMGVAHRDIKPENLLIDAKGHVKITDFGVSDVFRMCWEKKTHLSKGLCGSEPYIAPEQFEQKGTFSSPDRLFLLSCADSSHCPT